MPRGWTTISLYLDEDKYNYYSKLAEMRSQSRNSLLIQLVDYAIVARHKNGTLFSEWEDDANTTTTETDHVEDD
jgi:hypothetical protein